MSALLLVEDDQDLGETLQEQLTKSGFYVTWCKTQQEFQQNKQSFSVAVVDLNLPDGSGFEVLKSMKCPVIIMTALNTPENRLQGLELGAMDFIPKPFLFKELKLRIEKLISRSTPLRLGEVSIDLLARTVESKKEGTVFLNDRELKTLKKLMEKSPAVVTRDELLDLWSADDGNASHRGVDNIIVRLRQILNDEGHRRIRSVRGVGYQWIGDDNES